MSLPGFTRQCGAKYTGLNSQTLQDKESVLLLENKIRGGKSSVLGDGYLKSVESKNIFYIHAIILYGWRMSLSLPFVEINFDKNVKPGDIFETPDESYLRYFIECDLSYPVNTKKEKKETAFLS